MMKKSRKRYLVLSVTVSSKRAFFHEYTTARTLANLSKKGNTAEYNILKLLWVKLL